MKLLITFLLTSFTFLSGQDEIVLQPNSIDGKDAFLWSKSPNNNYGDHEDFLATAWTNSGEVVYVRSLLEFDLSTLPENAVVINATLSLYHTESNSNVGHSGSNAAYLKRIVEEWDESVVTWNNQPATTSENQVLIPSSTAENQDYPDIDVTLLIKDLINPINENFGLQFSLQNESIYRSMLFASSDNINVELRPKLKITYTLEEKSVCIEGILKLSVLNQLPNNPEVGMMVMYKDGDQESKLYVYTESGWKACF